jgi:putative membrane protein (TIGR04086 family)
MRIHWERILIVGILSELLLCAIYLPAQKYAAGSIFGIVVAVLAWLGSMFLGGLWVTRKVKSRFILHGFLVGIVASIVWFILEPIIMPGGQYLWMIELRAAVFKILVCMAGAYVGGMRRNKLLSAQTAK